MPNFQTVSAAGYDTIVNAIDTERFSVHPELIDEHRCAALTPRISDPALFANFAPCDSRILMRHRAKGITVQGLGRNTEITSTTPQECTSAITAGNYAVSQQKIAGIDRIDKCDFGSFWANVSTKRNWMFDDFVDRQALQMITSVNPCIIDRCGELITGTTAAPIDMNVDTSHLAMQYAQAAKFTNCDNRSLVMVVPDCYRSVFTMNSEFNDQFRHCCSLNAPQFTGEVPMVNNIRIEFSPFVPYQLCPDNTKVYTVPVFPEGVFGYASLVAHMEQIETNANIDHYSFAERLILKYAMGIADPTDYLNFKMKFTLPAIPTTTCV